MTNCNDFLGAVKQGVFTVPGDGGIDFTPVFALMRKQSCFLMPRTCSISSAVISGCAEGRSTLLITPIISAPASVAKYALATVCA